jgi:hypothetical protein
MERSPDIRPDSNTRNQPSENQNRVLRSEQSERWEMKLLALKTIRPTGDLIVDADAYFKATKISVDSLDHRYAGAYEHGDRQVLLEYFQLVASALNPASVQDETMREYFTAQRDVAQRIVEATEAARKDIV